MSIKDLAITYQSKKYKIENIISILNQTGIKGERYTKRLREIDKQIKEKIEEYNKEIIISKNNINTVGPNPIDYTTSTIDSIYLNGITSLEELEGELQKYDSYIKGYHYCEYLESQRNKDKITEEELQECVNNIITFINSINETDTREYEEEQDIVEKIYYMAYQIMKLEYITRGKSEIFEVSKNNPVIESFISNEIIKDINELKKNNKITPLIKQSISRVQSKGINHSYLDKLLITSIALEDSDSIVNKIKEKLDELLEKMRNNVENMESIKNEIKDTEKILKEHKENVHDTNISNFKEIVKRTTAGLIAAGILFGSYSLGKLAGKTKLYKTTKETYSTLNGYSCSEYRDKRVSNDELGTNLYKYEPYGEKNELNNGAYYKRKYTKYNITNISKECQTLDDFLKLNLEHAASIETDIENKDIEKMSEEDFYDETIYEVVKIIQDLDDYTIENNNTVKWFITILLVTICGAIYGSIIYIMVGKQFFDELEYNEWEKERIKELLLDLKNKLETFRKLADNNKEIKQEFIKLMENYEELLKTADYSTKLSDINELISIPDPQIELDKRTRKLLKVKTKKGN